MHLNDMAAVQGAFADENLFPPPAGPGAAYWLRSRVARFSTGPEHAHRRALAVAEIARVNPSHAARLAAARIAAGDSVRQAIIKAFSLVPEKAVDLIIDVAPSYFDPARPTESLEPLLDLLGRDEATVARIGVLVQACEATAALVDNDLVPPARTTKRVAPDGTVITLGLSELPFGAPPRECPGKHLALVIAQAIAEARA
jgi:cytochrome P450